VAYTYDKNGNLTYDGQYTYIYDYEDILLQIKLGEATIVSYAYDYRCRRVKTDYTLSATRYTLYCYDVYGKSTVRNASGEIRVTSDVNNRYLFTGREYDPCVGLYYYRARFYNPSIGCFMQTDPIGILPDGEIDNSFDPLLRHVDIDVLYEYVGNNPLNWIDPWGLEALSVIMQVRELATSGWSDFEIAEELGYPVEEIAKMRREHKGRGCTEDKHTAPHSSKKPHKAKLRLRDIGKWFTR
jgi:RHS repeat-associated protein